VLTPLMIVLIFVGVAIGIVFGSNPGLTATMAIVMFYR
jgi:putative tricarboxylic transport membrane protein